MTATAGSTINLGAMAPRAHRARAGAMLGLALLACSTGTALAAPSVKLTGASFMDIQAQVKSSKGLPNEEHRLRGLMSYQNGDYGDAASAFERAARFADKFSQHYLSLMHWHGVGVEADPVQGYIWADLAAERGSSQLLRIREKMWSGLTPLQRTEAMARGGEHYARYGDPVAKPRAEAAIRRFARNMTGSRVGYHNQTLAIEQGGPIHGTFGQSRPGAFSASAMANGGSRAEDFYADDRRLPSQYWQTQDRMLGSGRVEVGPLSVDREDEDQDVPR